LEEQRSVGGVEVLQAAAVDMVGRGVGGRQTENLLVVDDRETTQSRNVDDTTGAGDVATGGFVTQAPG
jgi:hypothetical protein